jgi:hypothetical protein
MTTSLLRIVISSVAAAVLVASSIFSTQAVEKKKISGVNNFGPHVSQSISSPGDVPNHEIVQSIRLDTVTSSDPDFNGSRYINYEQVDQVAGTGSHRGYGKQITKNGDEIYWKWEGSHQTVAKDGAWESTFQGTFQYVGGTGKFRNIKGSGTYKGTVSPKGGAGNWEAEVEY